MSASFSNITKLVLFATTLLSISCATMFKPTTHVPIEIYSSELDASIYLDEEKVSETFHEIPYPVKSEKKFTYRIEKNGFEPKTIVVEKGFNSYAYYNLLTFLFSPILFLIDYSNDALFVYHWPDENVILTPNKDFKEKVDSYTYKKFEAERSKIKNNSSIIQFSRNATSISAKDNAGNKHDIKNYELISNSGSYEIQSKFYTTINFKNSTSIYTATTYATTRINLTPASAAAICTDYDHTRNTTIHTLFQTSKPNPFLQTTTDLQKINLRRYCPDSQFDFALANKD